jgi:hypothetical protein
LASPKLRVPEIEPAFTMGLPVTSTGNEAGTIRASSPSNESLDFRIWRKPEWADLIPPVSRKKPKSHPSLFTWHPAMVHLLLVFATLE